MKKGLIINTRPISSLYNNNSKGLVHEIAASSLQNTSLINKPRAPRDTNIDLCALGINDSAISPKYMPGDDCPNKCGGLFILLRHYADVRDRLRFADNGVQLQKRDKNVLGKNMPNFTGLLWLMFFQFACKAQFAP